MDVRQGVALVEVELVEGAGGEGLAQGAVCGERDAVEQVREAEFAGFLGPGRQDSQRGGSDCVPGQLVFRQHSRHVAQADERFTYLNSHRNPGEPMTLDDPQDVVLQSLLFGLGCGGKLTEKTLMGRRGARTVSPQE